MATQSLVAAVGEWERGPADHAGEATNFITKHDFKGLPVEPVQGLERTHDKLRIHGHLIWNVEVALNTSARELIAQLHGKVLGIRNVGGEKQAACIRSLDQKLVVP